MDRKDIIISSKDLSGEGYCRLVTLGEGTISTYSYPFNLLSFYINFNITDRDLSIKLYNYLKEISLDGCNLVLRYNKLYTFFKNTTKIIWYNKNIIDNINYDPSDIKHLTGIYLRIFDDSISFKKYLKILEHVRSFFCENNIKVLVVDKYLTFRWDLEIIGRYLNGDLLSEYVTEKYFGRNLL